MDENFEQVATLKKAATDEMSAGNAELTEHGCAALREFLTLLLDDLKNGPAVLE